MEIQLKAILAIMNAVISSYYDHHDTIKIISLAIGEHDSRYSRGKSNYFMGMSRSQAKLIRLLKPKRLILFLF